MFLIGKTKLIKVFTLLMIAIFISTTAGINFAYSGMEKNDSNREYSNSSTVFGPGYLNATKYKTDAILYQTSKKKPFMESVMEYIKNRISNKVDTAAADKATPELKKKSSSLGDTTSSNLQDTSLDLNLGSKNQTLKPEGTLVEGKTEKTNGNIIAETYINNGKETRYVYVSKDAGYANNTLKGGIAAARNGDIVFVKSGVYSESISLNGINGIQITGENTATTIFDTSYGANSLNFSNSSNITINNFTFAGKPDRISGSQYYMGLTFSSCGNITIENNIIKNMGGYGIAVSYTKGTVSIFNNTITTCGGGIMGNNAVMTIENNTIAGNIQRAGPMGTLYSGQAIQIFGTNNDTVIVGNVIHDNEGKSISASSGFYFQPQNRPQNPIPDSYAGNYVYNNNLKGTGSDYALGTANYGYSPPTSVSTLSTPSLLQVDNAPKIETFMKSDFSKDSLYQNTAAIVLEKALNAAESENKSALFNQAAIDFIINALISKSGNVMDESRAIKLGEILKNPSEDAKAIIKTLSEIMIMIKNTDAEANEGLVKALQDFIEAIANLLLAQAMPDLLKEGDMANIKNIMTDLNTVKKDILMEYENNTRSYYEETKKLIMHNLALLKIKNIVSKTLTETELENISRSELDKLVKKIKDAKDKALDQILSEELNLRKQHIEPYNKMLQDKMKLTLKDFAKRISTALEGNNK